MNLVVKISRQDLYRFYLFHYKKFYLKSRMILMLVVLALVPLLVIPDVSEHVKFYAFTLMFILPSAVLISLFNMWLYAYSNAAKNSKETQGARYYRITDANIEGKTDAVSSVIQWTGIKKGFETKTDFYLYLDNNQAIDLPKHCFETETDVTDFRGMMGLLVEKASLLSNAD